MRALRASLILLVLAVLAASGCSNCPIHKALFGSDDEAAAEQAADSGHEAPVDAAAGN
jgi:hypothetical protein